MRRGPLRPGGHAVADQHLRHATPVHEVLLHQRRQAGAVDVVDARLLDEAQRAPGDEQRPAQGDVLAAHELLVEAADSPRTCRRPMRHRRTDDVWMAEERRQAHRGRRRADGLLTFVDADVDESATDGVPPGQCVDERRQPPRVHEVVGIAERQDVSRGRGGTGVAGERRAPPRRCVDDDPPSVAAASARSSRAAASPGAFERQDDLDGPVVVLRRRPPAPGRRAASSTRPTGITTLTGGVTPPGRGSARTGRPARRRSRPRSWRLTTTLACGVGEAPARALDEDVAQRRRQIVDGPGGHDPAGDVVLDELGDAADVGGDDRDADRHRLHQRHREALGEASAGSRRRSSEDGGDLGRVMAPAERRRGRSTPWRAAASADLLGERTDADHLEANDRAGVAEAGERVQEHEVTLLDGKACRHHDDRRVVDRGGRHAA